MEWKDLSYTLQDFTHQDGAKGDKVILKGINGWAKPKELTAIMGESGAGKTTFLDLLAMR